MKKKTSNQKRKLLLNKIIISDLSARKLNGINGAVAMSQTLLECTHGSCETNCISDTVHACCV
ncbi:class I lanthipeptide [Chitinophaga agrisoli]|uniref:class I lanthipeptide n=1 Tax=Chitinophaga agrisoli TaxID=2607653 RepID=UPI001661E4C9